MSSWFTCENGWCSIVMLDYATLPEGMSWNYVQDTVSGKWCEHLFQGRREARAGAHLLFLGFSDSILEGHRDIPRLCVAWNISWDNLSDGFSMNWNLAVCRSRENSLHWFKGNLKPETLILRGKTHGFRLRCFPEILRRMKSRASSLAKQHALRDRDCCPPSVQRSTANSPGWPWYMFQPFRWKVLEPGLKTGLIWLDGSGLIWFDGAKNHLLSQIVENRLEGPP